MLDTDLAYTAGFFDGEGCISISKNGAVDLRIVNTAKNVLLKIQSIFGGSITDRTQKVNKRQYAYSIYGNNAIEFLKLIRPYLLDKAKQADTILEYYSIRNDIQTISIPKTRGRYSNPDRVVLVEVFREILSEQKREEH